MGKGTGAQRDDGQAFSERWSAVEVRDGIIRVGWEQSQEVGAWERDGEETKRVGREDTGASGGRGMLKGLPEPHAELAGTGEGLGKPAERPWHPGETEAGVLHVCALKEWKLDSWKQMGVNPISLRWQRQGTMTLCG